jgi:DNA-binding NtrC family response regulator
VIEGAIEARPSAAGKSARKEDGPMLTGKSGSTPVGGAVGLDRASVGRGTSAGVPSVMNRRGRREHAGVEGEAPTPVLVCPPLVGSSPPMVELRRQIAAVASKDATVLIQGESGTGKELVARTIHVRSRRSGGPFVAVDCTGLRDTLLESQLFGHVKGAFTGADRATLGFIRSADGGTLFLDEIGEMDLKTQAKLLRCIQERAVVPLGSVRPVPVNVRFVAATHRDLKAMVARGEFREDLYYRLDVVRLQVPSLAARKADIPELCDYFLGQIAELYGEPRATVPAEVMDCLLEYHWPGNVRELANALEHMAVFSPGAQIGLDSLPDRIRESLRARRLADELAQQAAGVRGLIARAAADLGDQTPPARSLEQIMTLEAAERALIARTLQATGGNQTRAAMLLKIERRRLARKIRRYGLTHLVTGAREHDRDSTAGPLSA